MSAAAELTATRYHDASQMDYPALPTGNNSHLSDSSIKNLKVDDWIIANGRMPSPKLDLLAAIVDADDQTVESLLATLQQKGVTQWAQQCR
jgi:hypothetical protein